MLGTWDLVIYGMVFMSPIGPFPLYGIVSDASHGLVPLAYVFGAIVMGFTARSYALLGNEFPLAGSVYSYAKAGLHEHAGFFAGWLILLDYLLGPPLLYVVSAAALSSIMPGIPRWGWIIAFVVLGTGMNLGGVKFNARTIKVMLYAMFLVLAVFLVAGGYALYQGKGNGGLTLGSLYNAHAFSWNSMGAAVLISSINFLGFDAITTRGEEAKSTEKPPLGAACLLTLVLIALMFIAQTWVAADLAPGAKVSSADSAFYDISRNAVGPWLASLTAIAAAFAYGIACAVVGQSAISRILFAMARDRLLPHALAKVHPKTHQPHIATLFTGVVSLFVALGFQNRVDDIVLFQNFGALNAFVFVNLAVIGYFWFKQKSRRLFSHVVLPICGILAIGYLLRSMRGATLMLGGTWVLAGLVYYLWVTRVLGRRVALQT